MTVGPVDRVVAFLEQAGYERVDQPWPIGGIPFTFDAMLAGRNSLDLIAVVDLGIHGEDEPIRRQVEALAQALDLVRSRRSLTVVLAGPRRGAALIQAIAGVARILTVGTPTDGEEAELHDALAVLLPLEIALQDGSAAEVWAQTRDRLLGEYPAEIEPLLAAAPRGQAAVEAALAALLAEPLGVLWEDEDYDDGELE
jgi:hypothetical protein